jgi:hypothetical protein
VEKKWQSIIGLSQVNPWGNDISQVGLRGLRDPMCSTGKAAWWDGMGLFLA